MTEITDEEIAELERRCKYSERLSWEDVLKLIARLRRKEAPQPTLTLPDGAGWWLEWSGYKWFVVSIYRSQDGLRELGGELCKPGQWVRVVMPPVPIDNGATQ